MVAGIPNAIKPKIFKEIIHNEDESKNGLSLFISYSTIKVEFGGDMKFESSRNGTIFTIYLPL